MAFWITSWPFAEYVRHRWGGDVREFIDGLDAARLRRAAAGEPTRSEEGK